MNRNLKKVITVVLSGLLFGGVAGGTMVGINYLANNGRNIQSTYDEAKKEIEGADQPETKSSGKENSSNNISSNANAKISIPSSNTMLPDVSGIVEEAMPSLVSITNTMVVKQQSYGSIFDFFYGGVREQEYEVPASGSGVILKKTDTEYLIVTNAHVIKDSKDLTVQFIDGQTAKAAIKGADETVDIAVIAVSVDDISETTKSQLKVATLHGDEDIRPGQGCIAIGNALGYGQTVTVGYISALNRQITTAEDGTQTDLIQTDAAINPGNSGGALLNEKGELIGINVAKNANSTVDSVGFSIPIYKVLDIINTLSEAKTKIEVEETKQGRLGVYLATVPSEQAAALNIPLGVMVTGFSDEKIEGSNIEPADSPAKEAGILKNDIITKFDGQTVTTMEELQDLVKYYEAGTTVDITVQRLYNGDYSEKIISVTLGSVEDMPGMKNANEPHDDGVSGREGAAPDNGSEGGVQGNGNGNDNGSNGQQGASPHDDGQSGRSKNDDVYDLFKQFMEQYR